MRSELLAAVAKTGRSSMMRLEGLTVLHTWRAPKLRSDWQESDLKRRSKDERIAGGTSCWAGYGEKYRANGPCSDTIGKGGSASCPVLGSCDHRADPQQRSQA